MSFSSEFFDHAQHIFSSTFLHLLNLLSRAFCRARSCAPLHSPAYIEEEGERKDDIEEKEKNDI